MIWKHDTIEQKFSQIVNFPKKFKIQEMPSMRDPN